MGFAGGGGVEGGAGQAHPEVGLGKVVSVVSSHPDSTSAAFASRIFCSLVGGFLEVLCQCGKAWEALIIFCNFWKIPATSDFQNFY